MWPLPASAKWNASLARGRLGQPRQGARELLGGLVPVPLGQLPRGRRQHAVPAARDELFREILEGVVVLVPPSPDQPVGRGATARARRHGAAVAAGFCAAWPNACFLLGLGMRRRGRAQAGTWGHRRLGWPETGRARASPLSYTGRRN